MVVHCEFTGKRRNRDLVVVSLLPIPLIYSPTVVYCLFTGKLKRKSSPPCFLSASTSGMDSILPGRIFREGEEPEVKKINNSCRLSILKLMKESFPTEYRQVRADAVFSKIFDIFENKLCYSATMIHSIMCRQLETAKLHELWFFFGKRPLRFSLQEFHAVTGLKYKEDQNCNLDQWVDDNEFWSKLLKSGTVICLKDIRDKLVAKAKDWTTLDRVRLCYLCVIAGVLLVRDEKKPIPHTYIKLLMDFDKLRAYPWGLDSFDHLVKEIKAAREKLKNPRSYALNGFSFAFQIWIMEAFVCK